jgi:hypothetical protein
MPGSFNTLFATLKPDPWPSDDCAACEQLKILRDDSMREYEAYEEAVRRREVASSFTRKHIDASLLGLPQSEHAESWTYLHLRDVSGVWDDALCSRYFPLTCAGLQSVWGVVAPIDTAAYTCEGVACPPYPGHNSPGIVAFYRLAPGRCHLFPPLRPRPRPKSLRGAKIQYKPRHFRTP